MIVIDASAMIEALVGRNADSALLDGLASDVAAPHLLDTEVLSVLRGLTLGDKLNSTDADEARRHHFSLNITRHEAQPLSERVWELRPQYTAHDASYLALAEALDAPLYTCDRKLAAPGHTAEVRVFPQTH